MINLEQRYLHMLKTILAQYLPVDMVYIFGSRTTTSIKPFSDIDLIIMSEHPLPLNTMAQLINACEESDLPYKVDIVEWHTLSAAFQEHIKPSLVKL